MYIDYVANIRVPTEKAHGIQIFKMCEAFVRARVDLRLLVSARRSHINGDPFAYYGVTTTFPIQRIWSLDTVSWGAWGFRLQSICFAFAALSRLRAGATVYGRDELVLWIMSLFSRNPIVWESHTGAWNFFARALLKRCTKIVVISQGLKEAYVTRGVPSDKIIIAPDAVDTGLFDAAPTREESRRILGIPLTRKVALYAGHLYARKGVDTLAAAAAHLPEAHITFVGGTENDIVRFKEKWGSGQNIKIIGHVGHEKIPLYLRAADVLVLPNSGKDEDSARYTSPMKLFEYMASGTPIVASDVPAIREVLTDDSAFFVEPDSAGALAEGIRHVLDTPEESARRAPAARREVDQYTWEKRAARILARICIKN